MREAKTPWFCLLAPLTACALGDSGALAHQSPTWDAGQQFPETSDRDDTDEDEDEDKPAPSRRDASASSAAPAVDASVLIRDAGAAFAPSDASRGASALDASVRGECDGSTPHGCYAASADNPPGCPPQMPEQSDFYPQLEEWLGCESPWYVPCIYHRPDRSEANCSCDLGFHWLCVY